MNYQNRRKKNRGPDWVPKPITIKQIEWASDRYLGRYVATETQLRRVLKRRLQKNWRARGEKVTEEERRIGEGLITDQVKKVMDSGRVQDEKVALMWVEHLSNRGKSVPFIRSKLREKGVARDTIDSCIEQIHSKMVNPSLEAAVVYARKRRFGAYRNDETKQAERKQKDIASMMRAGHRYDVVSQVLECTSIDEIESLVDDSIF